MTGQTVLIAAFSGRAAAASARRAGFVPLVADLFADEDTGELAGGLRRVEGDLAGGFDEADLLKGLAELASEVPSEPIGVVYGAGFEDRPNLLREIAARWPVLGNPPEAIEAVKQPEPFAERLASLGIPHPEISVSAPSELEGWLTKQAGGAGGTHVGRSEGGRVYRQRRVSGRSVSALFIAHSGGTEIVGFSEQWTASALSAPYRFGGAVRPAALDASIASELGAAVEKAAPAFRLRGLNSADFMVGEGGWWLIEINPRLGATLDLFDDRGGTLFRAHLASVRGEPLPELAQDRGAAALNVVYASAVIPRLPRLVWPDWIADRPGPGTSIPADAPCWTVLATAETAWEARRRCRERARKSLEAIGIAE